MVRVVVTERGSDVARVQLYLKYARGSPDFRFMRPAGRFDSIPALRLQTYVDLMAQVRPGNEASLPASAPDCVIDTGSHLSIIPQYVWGQFKPGVIAPLPFAPAMPQSRRSVTVGGGRYPYDLGELAIRLRDSAGRTLDVRIVAQLTRDGGALTIPMTLGLRGGAIDGRVLRSDPDPAASFGQAWWLEDP